MKDFLSISKCCKHFNKLTNDSSYHRINLYWKYQSKITYYKDIDNNDKCIDNDWCEFYFQLKILSKKCKLTIYDMDLSLLMIKAIRFDLPSIVSFKIYKTFRKQLVNQFDNSVATMTTNFVYELIKLQRCSDMLGMCVAHDAIKTFKYMLSMLTQKTYFNENDCNKDHFYKIIDTIINKSSILCWSNVKDLKIIFTKLQKYKKLRLCTRLRIFVAMI